MEMFFRLCSLAPRIFIYCFAISVPQLSLTLLCFIISLLTYFIVIIVTVFPVIMLSITHSKSLLQTFVLFDKIESAKHRYSLGIEVKLFIDSNTKRAPPPDSKPNMEARQKYPFALFHFSRIHFISRFSFLADTPANIPLRLPAYRRSYFRSSPESDY